MKANFIAVGGPISVGKSTLVEKLPFPMVSELEKGDELQEILLENTYKKGRVPAEVIEQYFLQLRKKRYEEFSQTLQTYVFDRSIFESLWFAKQNMNKKSYTYFEKLWKSEIDDLIKNHGKPQLYILLTMNWDTFKNRLFTRGRDVEVINFSANEEFFRMHVNEYERHMIDVFDMFGIDYLKIDTDNLNAQQVYEVAIKRVNEVLNG